MQGRADWIQHLADQVCEVVDCKDSGLKDHIVDRHHIFQKQRDQCGGADNQGGGEHQENGSNAGQIQIWRFGNEISSKAGKGGKSLCGWVGQLETKCV